MMSQDISVPKLPGMMPSAVLVPPASVTYSPKLLGPKAHAALIRVAARAVDKDAGALGVRFVNDIGHPRQLRLSEVNKLLSRRFVVHDLAHDAHGGDGVLDGVFTKIDVDDRNAQLSKFVIIGGIFGGGFGLKVHKDHVRVKRGGLLNVEGAVFKAAKRWQSFNFRKAFRVAGVVPGSAWKKSSRQPTICANGASGSSRPSM